jgi:hypothetical protein
LAFFCLPKGTNQAHGFIQVKQKMNQNIEYILGFNYLSRSILISQMLNQILIAIWKLHVISEISEKFLPNCIRDGAALNDWPWPHAQSHPSS